MPICNRRCFAYPSMKGTRVSASRASAKDSATTEDAPEVKALAKKTTRTRKAASTAKAEAASGTEEKKPAAMKPRGRKKKDAEVVEEVTPDLEVAEEEDFDPTGEDLEDPDLGTDTDDEDVTEGEEEPEEEETKAAEGAALRERTNAGIHVKGGFVVSDSDETDEPVQQVTVAGATADPVKDTSSRSARSPC